MKVRYPEPKSNMLRLTLPLFSQLISLCLSWHTQFLLSKMFLKVPEEKPESAF